MNEPEKKKINEKSDVIEKENTSKNWLRQGKQTKKASLNKINAVSTVLDKKSNTLSLVERQPTNKDLQGARRVVSMLRAVKEVERNRAKLSTSEHSVISKKIDWSVFKSKNNVMATKYFKKNAGNNASKLKGGCSSKGTENEDIDHVKLNELQKEIIIELQQKVNLIEESESSLVDKCTLLDSQLEKERLEHEKSARVFQTEMEETKLKRDVLEEHFQALNQVLEQERSDECNVNGNKSIIQIDSSYLSELKSTVKNSKDRICEIEDQITENKKQSRAAEIKSSMEIQDLHEKVQCRETTIVQLERDLIQMRATHFKKKRKSNRRKGGKDIENDSPLSTIKEKHDSLSSISTRKDQSDVEGNVARVVLKKQKHAQSMEECREIMTSEIIGKEAQIKELENIIDGLENNIDVMVKESIRKENKKAEGPRYAISTKDVLNPRSIAITNEMINASMRGLQNMLTQFESEKSLIAKEEKDNSENNKEKSENSAPNKKRVIYRVVRTIELVLEELKISMRLLEYRMKNEIETIKQKTLSVSDNSAETSTHEKIENLMMQVKTDSLKSLKKIEISITKQLDELRDQVQTLEFEFDATQDLLESLEHDKSLRLLKNELAEDNNSKSEI